MRHIVRGAITAAVLVALTALVGIGPAGAVTAQKSTTPLSSFAKHCEQFGGLVGGAGGESATCIYAQESKYKVLSNVCRAAGGTLEVLPPSSADETTRLVCTVSYG